MSWSVSYLPGADRDLERLDNSQQIMALKAINKVSSNPQAKQDGGYGTSLGNKTLPGLPVCIK